MSALEPRKKVPRVRIRCPLEIFARKNSRGWHYSCHHPPCPRFRYSDLVASNRSRPQPTEEQEQEQEQKQTEAVPKQTHSCYYPRPNLKLGQRSARSAPSAPSECSRATSSVRYDLVVVVVVVVAVVGNFRSIRSLSSLMVEEEACRCSLENNLRYSVPIAFQQDSQPMVVRIRNRPFHLFARAFKKRK